MKKLLFLFVLTCIYSTANAQFNLLLQKLEITPNSIAGISVPQNNVRSADWNEPVIGELGSEEIETFFDESYTLSFTKYCVSGVDLPFICVTFPAREYLGKNQAIGFYYDFRDKLHKEHPANFYSSVNSEGFQFTFRFDNGNRFLAKLDDIGNLTMYLYNGKYPEIVKLSPSGNFSPQSFVQDLNITDKGVLKFTKETTARKLFDAYDWYSIFDPEGYYNHAFDKKYPLANNGFEEYKITPNDYTGELKSTFELNGVEVEFNFMTTDGFEETVKGDENHINNAPLKELSLRIRPTKILGGRDTAVEEIGGELHTTVSELKPGSKEELVLKSLIQHVCELGKVIHKSDDNAVVTFPNGNAVHVYLQGWITIDYIFGNQDRVNQLISYWTDK